jgi:hypothetical protein
MVVTMAARTPYREPVSFEVAPEALLAAGVGVDVDGGMVRRDEADPVPFHFEC